MTDRAIDELMLNLTDWSSQETDRVIEHMRKMRATGVKPRKAEAVEINTTSLAKLGLVPQGPKLVRRA